MISAKKLLENARNRIAKFENWTHSGLVEGPPLQCPCNDPHCTTLNFVDTCSPNATKWCALGSLAAEAGIKAKYTSDMLTKAMEHESTKTAIDALIDAVEQLWPELASTYFERSPEMIHGINDTAGHESTLEMFDKAIEILRSE